jgi:DNA invertase Pin-like site-specific DNA recombinase
MYNFVASYRVSTSEQGRSGLGLEAQRSAVAAFVAGRGADANLLGSFMEVESGKRDDRSQLAKALEHARLTGATLLIAKIDRLSRDAQFLTGLQKGEVPFTAVDMPEANNFTVGIMALVAQHEREAISKRTKKALAQAKKRIAITGQEGHPEVKRLGNPRGAAHLRRFGKELAVNALKAKAKERADGLAATFAEMKSEGITSAHGMAKSLNARGFTTPRGGEWSARTVLDVMERMGRGVP